MVHHTLHHGGGQLSHCLLHLELHPPAHEALESLWLPAEKANILNTLREFLPGSFTPISHHHCSRALVFPLQESPQILRSVNADIFPCS